MKNWVKIRPHLIENFKSVFTDYLSTQSFDFENGIDLFGQVCSINEVDDALYNYYELDESSKTARSLLASKLESFVKKLFFYIDGSEINGEMAACLKRFFQDSGVTNRTTINEFFSKDSSKKPIFPPTHFTLLFPFGESLKYVYDLRNAITHEMSISVKSASHDIHELVTVYLYLTFFYYNQIKSELVKREEPTFDFTNYLNLVKNQFVARIGRFIHINGQEDIALTNSYAVERVEYNDLSNERKGTIDELRKNRIPENKMMIWGDAGTGKSTSLEYLAYIDADAYINGQGNKIPVYLPLSLLTDSSLSILDYIHNKLNIEPSHANKLLKDGLINIFLDGINEIPKDDNYKLRTLRSLQIENILRDFPECFTIISNRPQDIQIFSSVPVFRLIKMNDAQIQQFLSSNVDDEAIRNKIQIELDNNQRLKEIIRVPLMLSRFVDVVINSGDIPKSRGEIIHQFISSLYTRERIEKKDAAFDALVINRLLAFLGHESLENNETNSGLTQNEVINAFVKARNEIGSQIDVIYVLRIVTELGILEKRDGLYTFAHQEYQDYFNVEHELITQGQ